MQDLYDLLVAEPEVTLTFASAINDRVQIAADGELSNFTHTYRLTPVAEEEDQGADALQGGEQ